MAVQAMAEAARAHADKALAVLVENLSDENASVRHKAAEALRDRGFGKPAQMIAGDPDNPLHARVTFGWAKS